MPNGNHRQSKPPLWKRLSVLALMTTVILIVGIITLSSPKLAVLTSAAIVLIYIANAFYKEGSFTKYLYAQIVALGGTFAAVIGLQFVGFRLGIALITALLVYGALRFLTAWLGRIRYWYARGTRGSKTWYCSTCQSLRYRVGGDLIPHCYECGWRPGLPVLRWFRYSVIAQQGWRTLRRARIKSFTLAVIAFVVIIAGTVGTGIATIDKVAPQTSVNLDEGMTPTSTENNSVTSPMNLTSANLSVNVSSQSTPTPGAAIQEGYNRTLVELYFIKLLNKERSARDLPGISRSAVLSDMGEEHSRDMAEHDYIGHMDSEGRTIRDRYEERGLLPKCNLPIEGSDRYYSGAENAAGAWVERKFESSGGSYFVTTEQELAKALFSIWMNSPPHRQAMLVHSADEAGLGLTITESGKVYAALELC